MSSATSLPFCIQHSRSGAAVGLDEAVASAKELFKVEIDVGTAEDDSAKSFGVSLTSALEGDEIVLWIGLKGPNKDHIEGARAYLLACLDYRMLNYHSRLVNLSKICIDLIKEDQNFWMKCLEKKFRVCVKQSGETAVKISGKSMAVAFAENSILNLQKKLSDDVKNWLKHESEAQLRRTFAGILMEMDRTVSVPWTTRFREIPAHILEVLCEWAHWMLDKEMDKSLQIAKMVDFDVVSAIEPTVPVNSIRVDATAANSIDLTGSACSNSGDNLASATSRKEDLESCSKMDTDAAPTDSLSSQFSDVGLTQTTGMSAKIENGGRPILKRESAKRKLSERATALELNDSADSIQLLDLNSPIGDSKSNAGNGRNSVDSGITLDDSDVQFLGVASSQSASTSTESSQRRGRNHATNSTSGNGQKKFAMSNSPRRDFLAQAADAPEEILALIKEADSSAPTPPGNSEPVFAQAKTVNLSSKLPIAKSSEPEIPVDKYAGERKSGCLLRPISIDVQNVAFKFEDNRAMNPRGVAIVAKHFIEKGHHVMAFIPEFYDERKAVPGHRKVVEILKKLGILTWSQSRKLMRGNQYVIRHHNYDDLYVVDYAHQYGGIVISGGDRYRDIYDQRPELRYIIEERILVPTFLNESQVMFPPDGGRGGRKGRGGGRIEDELLCTSDHDDVPKLTEKQLTEKKQKYLLGQLDLLLRGLLIDVNQVEPDPTKIDHYSWAGGGILNDAPSTSTAGSGSGSIVALPDWRIDQKQNSSVQANGPGFGSATGAGNDNEASANGYEIVTGANAIRASVRRFDSIQEERRRTEQERASDERSSEKTEELKRKIMVKINEMQMAVDEGIVTRVLNIHRSETDLDRLVNNALDELHSL